MEPFYLIGIVFLLLFVYGVFSDQLNRWSISGPMVFTLFGYIFSQFINSNNIPTSEPDIELVGQIALIAILFTDASSISLKNFFSVYKWPILLLFIGLPITMLFGWGSAILLFPGENMIILAIMAFVLSPTDAALGQAVVNSKDVPLKVRETINVESGLNDGLVLPPIIIAITLLNSEAEQLGGFEAFLYVLKQIALAPLVGGALGWAGAKLISWSAKHKMSDQLFQGISIVAIAIVSFMIAEFVGGNGYIAAFVSGLYFNVKSNHLEHEGQEFGEFLSQPLALFVFFAFGALFIPKYLSAVDAMVVLYALLSLTVFRMLPVLLSINRVKIPFYQKLFISWFGPRGIASILYLLMILNAGLDIPIPDRICATIVLTVLLSVFSHGLSAVPYAKYVGSRAKNISKT